MATVMVIPLALTAMRLPTPMTMVVMPVSSHGKSH